MGETRERGGWLQERQPAEPYDVNRELQRVVGLEATRSGEGMGCSRELRGCRAADPGNPGRDSRETAGEPSEVERDARLTDEVEAAAQGGQEGGRARLRRFGRQGGFQG
ncbi:hypothetical protein VTN00DRAFT_900 [Thermoascus crustaceus]|uniref:uncharacterized protein n=1 Tax=Thermoascus crustaceus TaxID=5088 RepID=UPI003743B56E